MTAKIARINRHYQVSVRNLDNGYNRHGIFDHLFSAFETLAEWRQQAGG